MNSLDRTVRAARRRLTWQQFGRTLPFGWFVGLLALIVPLVVDKFSPLGISTLVWFGIALSVGTLGATFMTWRRRASLLDAAYELDRRCGLQERLSSALALTPDEREAPAGQALVADALRRADRIAIAEQLPFEWSRWNALPLAPIAILLLIIFLWPPATVTPAAAALDKQTQVEQVRKSSEQLRKQLEEQRQNAEKNKLAEAEQLFAKLEKATKGLAESKGLERKEALVQLNDLAKQLEERQRALGAGESMKRQLDRLQSVGTGPAEKLAEALKKGDFEQAAQQMKQLREALGKGALDAQGREQLSQQLDQLQKQLQAAADAQQKQRDKLAQQRDAARQAGRNDEAERLERQIEQHDRQQAQQKAMQQLAQKMNKAAEAMRQGNQGQAQEQMQQLEAQAEAIRQQMQEGEMLAEALDQLQQGRQAMNCPDCEGDGCEACQGGNKQAGNGKGGVAKGNPGKGIGQGRGQGFQDERKVKDGGFDTQVKQNKPGRGAPQVIGFVEGSQTKGEVQQAIREQWTAVEGKASDPLADQPLPRDYREHAKQYFDALRTGQAKP